MRTVIICDDHAVVRRGIREILAESPHLRVVAEAGNGEEALALAREHRPDLVILDLSMPGRGGLDVIDQLRGEPGAPAVLVLSMHPEEQFAVRALRLGAAGYLTKDSASTELLRAVEKVLTGGRYVSETLAELLAHRLDASAPGPRHERLTDREFQVMHMLASGKRVSEVAQELHLSVKTISSHRSRILEKLELGGTVDLVRYALEHGMIQ